MSHTMEDKDHRIRKKKSVKRSTYFLEIDKIDIWHTREIKSVLNCCFYSTQRTQKRPVIAHS